MNECWVLQNLSFYLNPSPLFPALQFSLPHYNRLHPHRMLSSTQLVSVLSAYSILFTRSAILQSQMWPFHSGSPSPQDLLKYMLLAYPRLQSSDDFHLVTESFLVCPQYPFSLSDTSLTFSSNHHLSAQYQGFCKALSTHGLWVVWFSLFFFLGTSHHPKFYFCTLPSMFPAIHLSPAPPTTPLRVLCTPFAWTIPIAPTNPLVVYLEPSPLLPDVSLSFPATHRPAHCNRLITSLVIPPHPSSHSSMYVFPTISINMWF